MIKIDVESPKKDFYLDYWIQKWRTIVSAPICRSWLDMCINNDCPLMEGQAAWVVIVQSYPTGPQFSLP